MKVKGLVLFSLLFFCVMSVSSQRAEAATVRQQFKASVAELQKNPDNQELRKKIIKLARKLKPKPKVPEEAERYMARGSAAVEFAKDVKGYRKAVVEFEKAALAAPWLPMAYYNLGIVSDKTGDYAGAMKNLKLYLLAAPRARNAKKVKSLIYKIEFKLEQKNYAASAKGKAEAKKAEMDKFLDSLDGGKWLCSRRYANSTGWETVTTKVEKRILKYYFDVPKDNYHAVGPPITLSGRRFLIPNASWCREYGKKKCDAEGTISEDGEIIVYPSLAEKAVCKRQ